MISKISIYLGLLFLAILILLVLVSRIEWKREYKEDFKNSKQNSQIITKILTLKIFQRTKFSNILICCLSS